VVWINHLVPNERRAEPGPWWSPFGLSILRQVRPALAGSRGRVGGRRGWERLLFIVRVYGRSIWFQL